MSQMRRARRSGRPKPDGLVSSAKKGTGAVLRRTGSRLGRIGMGSLAVERIFLLLGLLARVELAHAGIEDLRMVGLRTVPTQAEHMPFPLSMGGVHPQHRMPAGLTTQTAGRLLL